MKITINERIYTLYDESLPYETVVLLAGFTGTPSAVYRSKRNGDSSRSGVISPGQSVVLEEEMAFSVAHTGNA